MLSRLLSRRLPTTLSQLQTLARASSTAASPPGPPVPASESGVESQSPNYPTTWSTSQRPRPAPHSGPRFEQTFTELQPNPLSAMELVANEPVRIVRGRKAVCDGGGGPLGHPKIFINLVRTVRSLVIFRFADDSPRTNRVLDPAVTVVSDLSRARMNMNINILNMVTRQVVM